MAGQSLRGGACTKIAGVLVSRRSLYHPENLLQLVTQGIPSDLESKGLMAISLQKSRDISLCF